MALPPPSYSDRQLPLLYFGHACLIGFGVRDPSVDLQGYVSTIHTFDRNLMSHIDEILGECERPLTQLAFFPFCYSSSATVTREVSGLVRFRIKIR